jgi:RND superfamily putative drug exporter
MLGPKVDALSVRPWLRRVFHRAPAATTSDHGAWYRIAK